MLVELAMACVFLVYSREVGNFMNNTFLRLIYSVGVDLTQEPFSPQKSLVVRVVQKVQFSKTNLDLGKGKTHAT